MLFLLYRFRLIILHAAYHFPFWAFSGLDRGNPSVKLFHFWPQAVMIYRTDTMSVTSVAACCLEAWLLSLMFFHPPEGRYFTAKGFWLCNSTFGFPNSRRFLDDEDSAISALDGAELMGRQLRVNKAKPKKDDLGKTQIWLLDRFSRGGRSAAI